MVEQGWHHRGLTRLIETETMHERKQLMAELSDGIIALPGGCGTMEELLEVITWKQLGLYLNPIVILNVNGFMIHCCKCWSKPSNNTSCVPNTERSGKWANKRL